MAYSPSLPVLEGELHRDPISHSVHEWALESIKVEAGEGLIVLRSNIQQKSRHYSRSDGSLRFFRDED